MSLEFLAVSHFFESGQMILQDVNFKMERGDLVKIGGSNGAGKTTFLRIASSHLQPRQGLVNIDGLSFQKSPDLYRDKISWLHSGGDGFFPRLTGEENLRLFFHYRSPQMDLKELIRQWELLPVFKKTLKTQLYLCSSGMKQILSLFRSLETPSDWILLDEPCRSLDAEAVAFVEERLHKALPSRGLLIVSHSKDFAKNIVTREYRIADTKFF